MKTKNVIYLLVIIIIAAVGFYFYQYSNKTAEAPTVEDQTSQNQEQTPALPGQTSGQNTASTTDSQATTITANSGGNTAQGTFSAGEEDMGPDIQVVKVAFDGSKFSPGTVNIKVNDYVIFENQSTVDFWPASDQHPVHTIYPEFDAKKRISPGSKYQFQFTKAGSWGYHDHLNPSLTGTVIVSQ